MKFTTTLLTLAAISCNLSLATAQTTFVFHDGGSSLGSTGSAFTDAEASIQDTVNGITLTAEAFLDATSTANSLYGTNSGSFGINNSNTDASSLDDGDRFDNLGGIESMEFSFNVNGTFQSIDLRFIDSASNEAILSFDGGNTYDLNTSNDETGDTFTINESFTIGQKITLQISPLASAGENFSLESFTIVPEPATYAVLAGILTLGYVMLKHRR